MIISRGLRLCKTLLQKQKAPTKIQIAKSHGNYTYRSPPEPPSKLNEYVADGIGGFMWWWVLWHLWTEFGHIVGEFPYPEPNRWTDAELGIPPDEEGL